ncbi:hypothetical protein E4U19_003845 [Claviceps sp. Clav32 group G5]|nr:hypothetical protein E4U19_003845 [Claviceps sp. Clav32 group G5]
MSLFSRSWKKLCSAGFQSTSAFKPSPVSKPNPVFKPSPAWKPLEFPREGLAIISADEKIEEENLPDYATSRYYPVTIGEIFRSRYQVVGKLGFGTTLTVWLARDLTAGQHVALKLYVESDSSDISLDNELKAYKRIQNTSTKHPGRYAVRSLLDSFPIDGPNGRHQCLVHPPLWDSLYGVRHRNPVRRFPEQIMALVLARLFQALDLLHQECHIAHTDIQEGNLLFSADKSVLSAFEQEELDNPSPRKELDGKVVYQSRELGQGDNISRLVLSDFGSSMRLDDGIEHMEDIQPDVYRAPEVILQIPWTYSVDIWNAGCLIWDCFQGGHLFTGREPEFETYRSRAHLAEIIALLGPPPPSLLARANLRSKFFSDTGNFRAGISLPEPRTLEQREKFLKGEDKECFLRLMRKMLQWEPEKRSSAKELLKDEWILKHLGCGQLRS